jgi:segregation and condensation protein B
MNADAPLLPASDSATLASIVEAILFVAGGPVQVGDLAHATGSPQEAVEAALDSLGLSLHGRGLRLQRYRDQAQLVTAPEYAHWIDAFLGLDLTARLSAAALETLGIIAYRQPITRSEIDAIRGVNSSGTLRTLIQRELIEEAGRLETVGHPHLYATTPVFLQYFGLASLDDLPPLDPEEAARMEVEP